MAEEAAKPGLQGSVLKQLVFLPFVQYPLLPRVPDLSDPARCHPELTNSSNFYISAAPGVSSGRIGAWYFLPEKSSGKVESLAEGETIVLYLHGNSFNRAQGHRLGLYSLLLKLGYHVLAIDYRGFGDSSPVALSESTVVSDARTALTWITDKLGDKAKILIWGHSLGSAIACHMVADLDLLTGGSSTVSGVVLEAPFNSMYSEVMTFKMAKALSLISDVQDLLEQADIVFDSEKWLPAIKCPVLILHAEDDAVVPFQLGQQLYEEACQAGKTNIRFVKYGAEEKLGHCGIYTSEATPTEVKRFVEEIGKLS